MKNFSIYQSLTFDKILISLLEKEGIVINTPTAIDIQKILANTPTEAQSFGKLKYKIAPILCRNKEDQEKIYQIFDEWDNNSPIDIVLPTEKNPPIPPDNGDKLQNNPTSKISSIFLVLIGVGILLWCLLIPSPIKPEINIDMSNLRIINTPIKFSAFLTDTTGTEDYYVEWSFNGEIVKNKWEYKKTFATPNIYSVKVFLKNKDSLVVDSLEKYVNVLCEEKAKVIIFESQTNEPNTELYVPIISDASKDSAKYTYQWFVDNKLVSTSRNLSISKRKFNNFREIDIKIKCNGTHCDTNALVSHLRQLPSTKSQIIPSGKPLRLNNSINWRNLFLLIFWYFIIPFIISIILFYLLRKKKPVIPPQIEESHGIEEPYSIEFVNQDFFINDENEVNNLADKLRKRQLSEILKLNIRKTIKSSLTSIGFPQFVFNQLSKPTEYVILFDNERIDSHLTRLFGYLIKKLQSEQVNLTVYEYYQEPLFLSNEKLNLIRIPIERVATFHPDSTLIIIGDSKNFVYPIKKVVKDWVITKFRTWETKILLTPFSINDWDIKERLLSESGFLIIPSDMNAQNNIDKVIFKQVDTQHDLQIPTAYPARFLNLQTIEGLKTYLNNQYLMDWVCSLAVYPYTDWNLTIALGHALEEKLNKDGQRIELLNYTNLLKLSRIGWMHDGSWNEGLRVEMLQQLSNELEMLARETLLKQLEVFKEKITEKSLIRREFNVHQELNSFLLAVYQKDPNSIGKEPIVKNMLDKFYVDEATEIYLNKGANTLLKNPINRSESISVRDYFEASNETEKHKRRHHNFRSFLISSLALVLLMVSSFNILKHSAISNWKKSAKSMITFKFKSLSNNSTVFYDGIIEIDSVQKEFIIKKDTSFSLKVPVLDTNSYGKYQLQYFGFSNIDFKSLDSFKLNNNSYTLSLENTPQIPVTIFYSANNKSVAESIESYFSGAFDIKKKQTIAAAKDYIVYYSDKKYESYANSCASIINKNLNKSINVTFISDTTKSIFPPAKIGIVIPKSDLSVWLPATLPNSLTKIWQGKINNLLLTINLSKRVLYYSTKGRESYGTYGIYKVFQKDGKFKVIVSSNKGYKLFFFKNVTPNSFDISLCFKYFETDVELYSILDTECNAYMNLATLQQFSQDSNRFYLPLNTIDFNWDRIINSHKLLPNNKLKIEYTTNPFLPSIYMPNLIKTKLSQENVQVIKSKTLISNPFDRNYVQLIVSTEPVNVKPSTDTHNKVLWVGESSKSNLILIESFKKNNITVKLVSTNIEALQLLKKEKYNLVITEVVKANSESNGVLNLLQAIRKTQVEIPLIFYHNPENGEESMDELKKMNVKFIANNAYQLEYAVNRILFPKPATLD